MSSREKLFMIAAILSWSLLCFSVIDYLESKERLESLHEMKQIVKEMEIVQSNKYHSKDFFPNETKSFISSELYSMPAAKIDSVSSIGTKKLDRAIERSVNMAKDGSFAYNFSCGYEIDGILIHEGIPRYGQGWWGFAVKDRIVIKEGLSDEDKMGVFAHELMHYRRMQNGSFNRYDLEEEERLAYLYGWNESNWDEKILRHKCVR